MLALVGDDVSDLRRYLHLALQLLQTESGLLSELVLLELQRRPLCLLLLLMLLLLLLLLRNGNAARCGVRDGSCCCSRSRQLLLLLELRGLLSGLLLNPGCIIFFR